MKIVVTTKSVDNGMDEFNYLIPLISEQMEQLINSIITMDNQPLNLDGLNTIHFTDDYRKELFDFEKSIGHHAFATRNKIVDGHAKVVKVKDGEGKPEDIGYHIFIDKKIPLTIMIGQLVENASNLSDESIFTKAHNDKIKFIQMIKHELAHVEDANNQTRWEWKESLKSINNVRTILRQMALQLWKEFYACKRSSCIDNLEIPVQEFQSLLNNLEKAEKEICDLRMNYTTNKIPFRDFVASFHDYIISALILCCYYIGHMNQLYEQMIEIIRSNIIPSRFYYLIPEMWEELHNMEAFYPEWTGPEILDGLAGIMIKCINSFEVYLSDDINGIHYDIPICKLIAKRDEAQIQ